MEKKNYLGSFLKAVRRSKMPAVSQSGLSGLLRGVGIKLDRSAIARIECGTRKLRDYELLGFMEALDITPEEIAAAYQSASATAASKIASQSSSSCQTKSKPVRS
jgi:hypothetical protein